MEKVIAATVLVFIILGGIGTAAAALFSSPAGIIGLLLVSAPVVVCAGLGLFMALIFVMRYAAMSFVDVRRSWQFVSADENGLLPVATQALLTNMGAMRSLDAHTAKATAVPSHINYAPRFTGSGAEAETLEQVAQAFQPETFWQLWQANKLPSQGFLMGFNLEDGEPVTADWGKLYSALIGGQSGSGKSTLIRSILAQSAIQGGRFVVLDKHYGAGEESLGESLQPLRHLMLCDVAASEQQMVDALAYVRNIGDQRLAGASTDKTPVVLVVDETTAVLQRSTTAQALTDVLGQIAQETRKVGVYALCIGQNFHSKIMDTTVRDSFVSFLSCRARRRVASTMTDNNDFGKLAQDLTIGQAVWMTPAGDVHRLAVPNCTEHDLELVATRLGAKTDAIAQNEPLPPVNSGSNSGSDSGSKGGSDARAERVRQALQNGQNMSQIIAEIWGVEGRGRKYQQATEEFYNTLRQLTGSN